MIYVNLYVFLNTVQFKSATVRVAKYIRGAQWAFTCDISYADLWKDKSWGIYSNETLNISSISCHAVSYKHATDISHLL